MGGGYSSVDKFIATAELTQGNLFGKGQYVKLKADPGGVSSFYELSFRDPYFLDSPYALSTVFTILPVNTLNTQKSYRILCRAWERPCRVLERDVSYNLEKATIYNIEDDASRNNGTGGHCDNQQHHAFGGQGQPGRLFGPLPGFQDSATFTFAGSRWSNAFIKGLLDSGWYFPVGDTNTTIMLRGRFGYASGIFGKNLPLYENFYVGGIDTVRGLGFGKEARKTGRRN